MGYEKVKLVIDELNSCTACEILHFVNFCGLKLKIHKYIMLFVLVDSLKEVISVFLQDISFY